MIEIIIERWSSAMGSDDYHWSVWRDGHRLRLGGPSATAEASEEQAKLFCQGMLGCEADRITRL